MLEVAGFEMIDPGVNVLPESYVEAICGHHPDVVGMSALLSTTMPMFTTNIELITEAGLGDTVLICVGDAPVTRSIAEESGQLDMSRTQAR